MLHVVRLFLQDGVSIVNTQRTEGRSPDQAGAHGGAPLQIGSDRAGNVAAVERGGVGEDRAAKAEALGQDRERELGFGGSVEIGLAADVIDATTRRILIRADAVVIKAANDAIAAREMIEHAEIAIKRLNVTGADREQADQIKLFRQRVVIGAARGGLDELGIATKTGNLKRQVRIKTECGFFMSSIVL